VDNLTPATPPLETWIEPPMVICRWCGFMVKYGRGNVEHIDYCDICKQEADYFASQEVSHA